MKILVVGGTGLVGSAVGKELLARDADLRLLVRDSQASVPNGVEVAIGELLDPPAVQRAMTGVDKLYLLNAVTPDELCGARCIRSRQAAQAQAYRLSLSVPSRPLSGRAALCVEA